MNSSFKSAILFLKELNMNFQKFINILKSYFQTNFMFLLFQTFLQLFQYKKMNLFSIKNKIKYGIKLAS